MAGFGFMNYLQQGLTGYKPKPVIDLTGRDAVKTYTAPCHCINCSWRGEFRLPRGQEAPGYVPGPAGEDGEECPNCGCKTVGRG